MVEPLNTPQLGKEGICFVECIVQQFVVSYLVHYNKYKRLSVV